MGKVRGGEPPRPFAANGLFVVHINSKAMYKLLQKPTNIYQIRRFTEHCEECAKSFLRGFFR